MRITLLILSLLTATAAQARIPVLNVSDLYGGRGGLELLGNCTSIRACQLEPVSGDWNRPPETYAGYRIRGTSELREADVRLVRALLRDEATYDWPDQVQKDGSIVPHEANCQPFYHVRLELRSGDDVLAVNFCFFCPGVLVAKNDRVLQHAYLGPKSHELLQLLARVFPRDKLLRTALARQAQAATPVK